MKTVVLILFIVLGIIGQLPAQVTDTIKVFSSSMGKEIPNIIILPESYSHQPDTKYPVVYLLHGHGGNFSTWARQVRPDLDRLASFLDLIIVCPDGANGWYWDSPVNPSYRFETYVSKELIAYIDQHYRTVAARQGRAITGFSMGGHGGLWLGFRHPDIYSACGSMSGGVDIRPFPNNWNMKEVLGSYAENEEVWNQHTVMTQIPYSLKYGRLAIIIDCGTDDFFYKVNEKLHEKLLYNNIPHDYIIRPGGHTQQYWKNAIDYQLLYLKKALHAPSK